VVDKLDARKKSRLIRRLRDPFFLVMIVGECVMGVIVVTNSTGMD
jgi:hypothetical protein